MRKPRSRSLARSQTRHGTAATVGSSSSSNDVNKEDDDDDDNDGMSPLGWSLSKELVAEDANTNVGEV